MHKILRELHLLRLIARNNNSLMNNHKHNFYQVNVEKSSFSHKAFVCQTVITKLSGSHNKVIRQSS